MSKIKIGVARGGPSSEYDISLKTGANVLKFLPEKYEGVDILENMGIKTPRGFLIRKDDDLDDVVLRIFKNFSPPWVLKPVNKGSSVGVEKVVI